MEDGFRHRLHTAQLACSETVAIIAAVRILLDGGSKYRLTGAEKFAMVAVPLGSSPAFDTEAGRAWHQAYPQLSASCPE